MSAAIQSDRIFEALRDEILACQLPPASKIRIPEVCTRFGASAGAVREALSRLISESLVRNEPQKGFSVAPVSLEELRDLTEARIALECLCIDRAFTAGDVEWETQLVASYHRMSRIEPKRPGENGLSPEWSDAHRKFHAALVGACRNEVMQRLRAMLYQESERYRFWFLPLTGNSSKRDVESEHKALFEAAMQRDAALAKTLIAQHFQRTADLLASATPAINERTKHGGRRSHD